MMKNKGQCWKKQKEPLLMKESSTQKATCELKMVKFNAMKRARDRDRKCSLHYKNVKMSFLLPEITAQHLKTTNGWAVIFMQQKRLHLNQRTTLMQKHPMDHLENLNVNHSHIINTRQKYNYLLGKTDNAMKPQPFLNAEQIILKDLTHCLSKQRYVTN
jgi:hypothetical protein